MDTQQDREIPLPRHVNREMKTFNNEKLLLFNYLEKVLKVDIDDLIMLTQTIFILLTTKNYENMAFKDEIRTVLRLIMQKFTFLVPASDNLMGMIQAIFEKDYIQDIETVLEPGCVRVKIVLKPLYKQEFFKKYKKIFNEISLFFKSLYNHDFKFLFS
jgi:hypothetical protein